LKPLLMRKLWLTLDETAQHLSAVYEEEVTKSDILYFALYDSLTLSIQLVNKLFGRQVELVSISEIQAVENKTIGHCDLLSALPGSRMNDNETFLISDRVCKLHGLWDLPMLGAERLQIEALYHRLSDGPPVTDHDINGALLRSIKNDELFQVCDCSEEENANSPKKHKQSIAPLNPDKTVSMVEDMDGSTTKKMLNIAKSKIPMALPEHSVFVIRHESLKNFEAQIEKHATSLNIDPIRETYPQELNAALQVWRAIGRNTDDDNAVTKLKVKEWLKTNKDKYRLSTNAINRIATVCNWNRNGGRPKMH
jgi:hypothetical protein